MSESSERHTVVAGMSVLCGRPSVWTLPSDVQSQQPISGSTTTKRRTRWQ